MSDPAGVTDASWIGGERRYSGISLAFKAGGIIGALTPIAPQMTSAAGASNYVGLLLVAAGC